MAYPTLRDFVDALDAAGELHRIDAPVSPILEVTEIADRVSKSPAPTVSPVAQRFDPKHCELGGKALLFSNVEGSDYPLAINTFGSYRRMEMALGVDATSGGGGFEELAARIESIAKPQPPVGMMEKVRKGLELAKVAGMAPKVIRNGICQQIVKTGEEVNLFELPIIKCWPLDGQPDQVDYNLTPEQAGTAAGQGRYITFGGIYTIHPDDAGATSACTGRN
jgi:4-hydroxy-3-polyprenylbenzoate decarboxylase